MLNHLSCNYFSAQFCLGFEVPYLEFAEINDDLVMSEIDALNSIFYRGFVDYVEHSENHRKVYFQKRNQFKIVNDTFIKDKFKNIQFYLDSIFNADGYNNGGVLKRDIQQYTSELGNYIYNNYAFENYVLFDSYNNIIEIEGVLNNLSVYDKFINLNFKYSYKALFSKFIEQGIQDSSVLYIMTNNGDTIAKTTTSLIDSLDTFRIKEVQNVYFDDRTMQRFTKIYDKNLNPHYLQYKLELEQGLISNYENNDYDFVDVDKKTLHLEYLYSLENKCRKFMHQHIEHQIEHLNDYTPSMVNITYRNPRSREPITVNGLIRMEDNSSVDLNLIKSYKQKESVSIAKKDKCFFVFDKSGSYFKDGSPCQIQKWHEYKQGELIRIWNIMNCRTDIYDNIINIVSLEIVSSNEIISGKDLAKYLKNAFFLGSTRNDVKGGYLPP